LETAQGKFTITELDDGSVLITETSHKHLAVLPRSANGLQLQAFNGEDFVISRPAGTQ
jgi:hypothetical protein